MDCCGSKERRRSSPEMSELKLELRSEKLPSLPLEMSMSKRAATALMSMELDLDLELVLEESSVSLKSTAESERFSENCWFRELEIGGKIVRMERPTWRDGLRVSAIETISGLGRSQRTMFEAVLSV